MNDQQPTGPALQEQKVSPTPKNSNGKLGTIITLIIIVLIVVIGWYFYSQKKSSPATTQGTSKSSIVFDDSDMRASYADIPNILENSAPAFNSIAKNSITNTDRTTLFQYIASSTQTHLPPITQVNKILGTYPLLLKTFDENATKPYICNFGKGEACPIGSVRNVVALAGVRALVSFEQNKIADAEKTASNLVTFGKNIAAYTDAEIPLLIGWIAQKNGYAVLSIITSKNKTPTYSDAEKSELIAQLRKEHKKVLRYDYTRTAEGIDFITSPEKRPINQVTTVDEEEIVNEYRKAIAENPNAWNPIETKKYFYDSFKNMISNVDLPCGQNLPENKIETGFNPEDKKAENYIGRALYSTTHSGLNTLNAKRCEVETAIQML